MSYGRSSQIISLAGTGILINIGQMRWRPAAAMAAVKPPPVRSEK